MISVIVPIYNSDNFLAQCLDSIREQTFTDVEVILINDGSMDNSLKICKEFTQKDSRFQLHSIKNSGISVARNIGIHYASKPLLTFIDSDDWVEKDMLELLYTSLIENNADISCCGYFIDSSTKSKPVWNNGKLFIWNRKEALSKLFINKEIRDFAWGKLYKSELWENIRFPKGYMFEDIRTTYKVFEKANKIIKTEKSKLHYRQHNLSITSTKAVKNSLDFFIALLEVYNYINASSSKDIKNYDTVKTEIQRMLYRSQKQMIKCFSVFSKEYKELQKNTRSDYKQLISEISIFRFGIFRYMGVLITYYIPCLLAFFMKIKGKKE